MAEDFSRAVARVVASQLAEAAGFDAAQDSAVEILADLLLRYLSTLCTSSHGFAELAGRSQSNLADVLLALEELGVSAEDLHQHVQLQSPGVPFSHTLAPYPVQVQQVPAPSFTDQREQHPPHIPGFLPAFPDAHLYQRTPAFAGHQADAHKQRQTMLEAKQKAEAALNKLHQRMTSKANQVASNPFLAAPAVEQLPVQLPELQAAAAAAAAAAAGASSSAAAAAPAANGPGPDGGGRAGAAAAADGAALPQLLQPAPARLPGQPPPPLPPAATAAAAAATQAELEEDALFEGAAVLRAFAPLMPRELLEQQAAKASGRGAKGGGAAAAGGEPGAGERLANGLDDFIVEEEAPSAMDVDGGGAADGGTQGWLGWKPAPAGGAAAAQHALGPAGAAGPELLRFGVDALAAGKRAALSLSASAPPPDAYAAAAAAGGGRRGGGGTGSGRQRKSRYDVDPQVRQAEGILSASAEAMFAAVSDRDARLAEAFGEEDEG